MEQKLQEKTDQAQEYQTKFNEASQKNEALQVKL